MGHLLSTSAHLIRTLGIALAVVGIVDVVGTGLMGQASHTHEGRWTGFPGRIAPWEGPITFQVLKDGTITCALEGSTSSASGNGWAFRGRATVASTSCAGRISDDGTVSGTLTVHSEWHGQVRGWDSDWDDADGAGDCTGPLTGSFADGGSWQGACTGTGSPWTTTFQWTTPPR
jgi:hypothetical protein